MQQPEISIIIVTWNVREHLLRCLRALPAAVEDVSYEVIVVDNASEDGSAEAVKQQFPEVRLVVNSCNALYTRAANQGLALACGRYRLLLNPDVVPHPGSIARLVRYAEAHPGVGLLGPRILDASGRDDWRTGRYYPTPWSEFVDWSGLGRWFSFLPFLVKNRRLKYDRSCNSAVPLLSGACLLFPPLLPAPLRQLNPDFPMYGEDIDLCRRMDAAGFRKMLVGEAQMIHIGGASSAQQPAKNALLAVLAMNQYFRKWDGMAAAWGHRALLGLVALAKVMFFCCGSMMRRCCQRGCDSYRPILVWAVSGYRDDAFGC